MEPLYNTSACLGGVIARKLLLATGGKESIPVFLIGKKYERYTSPPIFFVYFLLFPILNYYFSLKF